MIKIPFPRRQSTSLTARLLVGLSPKAEEYARTLQTLCD